MTHARFLLALLFACASPAAAQTNTTVITNLAEASYSDPDGNRFSTASTPVTVTVRAVSGVNVTPDESAPSANTAPNERLTRLFGVCNTGNAADSYVLARGEVTAPAKLVSLYFDLDASGTFTPGDAALALGSTASPQLAPGACVGVLAVVDTNNSAPQSRLQINVTARSLDTGTANGVSQDDGAIIVAVGDGADFSSPRDLQLPPIKLVENQARVTSSPLQPLNYLISFRNRGAVAARNVVCADELPSYLEYLPGTLRVRTSTGTRAVTDADDGDEGRVSGRQLEVRLREVKPDEVVEIRFLARLTTDVLPGVGVVNVALVSGENVETAIRTSEAVAVINPFGTVYAGHSGGSVLVPGAQVSLSTDEAGSSPVALTPNFGSSPNAVNTNPFTSDAQGRFSFALAPANFGNVLAPVTLYLRVAAPGYRPRLLEVVVTPQPSGLYSATVRALDGQPLARAGSFALTSQEQLLSDLAALVMNVPVFEAAALEITKVADRQHAEIGDALTYRLEIRNATASPVSDAVVRDLLPPSFHYAAGTARIDGGRAGQRAIEPQVNGNELVFQLGEIPPGARMQLVYRVRVGANARDGEQFNSATVGGRFPSGETITTPPTRAGVIVGRGILAARQVLIGRVFEDANLNGLFEADERPVAGVRLYLSNGDSVITDSEGLYNFPSINQGAVVVSLDPVTLPQGYQLLDEGHRASRSWTRLLRTPLAGGGLLKQNFALVAPPERQEATPTTAKNLTPGARPLGVPASAGLSDRERKSPAEAGTPNTTPAATPGGGVRLNAADIVRREDAGGTTTFEVAAEANVAPVAPGDVLVVAPAPGAVVVAPALQLTVRVAEGWQAALEVDGKKIGEQSVGERRDDHQNKVTTLTFVGISLKPGPNHVRAAAVSPDGVIGKGAELTVYGRGQAKRLEIVPERAELAAGGRESTLVRVRAFDQWNNPAQDSQISVTTSSGRLVPKECLTAASCDQLKLAAEQQRRQREQQSQRGALVGAGGEELDGVAAEQVGVNYLQQVVSLTNGEAEVRLIAENTAGNAELGASVGDVQARAAVRFTAELRPAIMAGLAEMTFGKAAPDREWLREEDAHTQRMSFFYRGSFLHKNLLTVAYDSARPLHRTAGRDRLFQLDPLDRVYPLFGDSSVRYEDAQSNSKLYARLDRGRSYALFGDFGGDREEVGASPTQSSNGQSSFGGASMMGGTLAFAPTGARTLTLYSRNLTGVKVHVENKRGDFVSATGARPDTAFARDVFPGGSFTLVRLTRGDVLIGSETLVLEVRDRRNPDIVLSREPLSRSVDYNLDALTGTIFFLRPISAFDYALNLLQVVATYEYQATGLSSAVYTARGVKRFAGAGLRVGASFVNQRQSEFGPFYLGGVDGEKALPRGGSLSFEWGLSRGRVAAGGGSVGFIGAGGVDAEHNGHAFRLDWYQPLVFKEAVVRASFVRSDEGFFNPFGATVAPGSQRGVAAVEMKVRPSSVVRFGFADERNKTENVDNNRVTVSAGWTETIKEKVRVTVGYDLRRLDDRQNSEQITSSLVSAGLEWRATDKLNIAVKREQNLSEADPTYPNQTTIAASYQLNQASRIFMTQRLGSAPITPISDVAATGFSFTGARRETAIGVETKLSRYTSLNSHYQLENGVNGTDSFAVLGLTQRLPLNKKVSLDFGFERGFHLAGEQGSFTSGSVGFAWQPNDKFRSSARYDLRDRQGLGQMFTLGAVGKLNDAVSTLGRFQHAETNFGGRSGEATNAMAALAVRPLESDRAALLFSYNRRSYAQAGGALFGGRLAGETRDREDLLSSDGLVRLRRQLEFYGRFALRVSANSQPDVPYVSTLTLLSSARLQQGFGKYFDAAVEGRWINQPATSTSRAGAGAELGLWALPDLRLGVGYNFSGVREPAPASPLSPSPALSSRRGAYFTISSKLSNLFNLFGTSRDGLITVTEAEERGYLADNFTSAGAKKGAGGRAKADNVKLPSRAAAVKSEMKVAVSAAEVAASAPVGAAEAGLVAGAEGVPVMLAVAVGTHAQSADAEAHVMHLKQFGVEARVVRTPTPGAGAWYRVEAGRFTSVDDAGRYGTELYARGALTNFIIVEDGGAVTVVAAAEKGSVAAQPVAAAAAPIAAPVAAEVAAETAPVAEPVTVAAAAPTAEAAPFVATTAKAGQPVAASIDGIPVDRSVREGDAVTIQFSSHRPLAEANRRLAELRAAGVSARIVKVSVPGNGLWFRVRAGRFADIEEAARHGGEWQGRPGVGAFIITRHSESE